MSKNLQRFINSTSFTAQIGANSSATSSNFNVPSDMLGRKLRLMAVVSGNTLYAGIDISVASAANETEPMTVNSLSASTCTARLGSANSVVSNEMTGYVFPREFVFKNNDNTLFWRAENRTTGALTPNMTISLYGVEVD